MEKDSCGVGFLVSLKNESSHGILEEGLHALERMEHRGGVGPDSIGDGAGIMASIPHEIFEREAETFAVAFIFCPQDKERRAISLRVFEETFWQHGLKVILYREVPINKEAIARDALNIMPYLLQAVIERPSHCRTVYSFERLLYQARQMTRTKEKENGIHKEFFFSSLSPRNIVYKALCKGPDLSHFYRDLKDPRFKTKFALFHRRFSTNTISTWDKTQPFRLIAHNGEINTIECNKAWAITREKELGLKADELITHEGISDSGSLNGIAEGLRYRSSIPKLAETLAILIPPATTQSSYYKFWGRGMEPWDGPAMVAFSDGKHIGARLDRNGFRPARWQRTEDHFYLASEAGVFKADPEKILEKGSLSSGESVMANIFKGSVSFLDPQDFPENQNVFLDSRTTPLTSSESRPLEKDLLLKQKIFNFKKDEIEKILLPMAITGKEPIGSMGDTACLAFLSNLPRSLFDFFFQHFAQVTNPPIDYIREKIVTDMRVYLGRKPNIFEPKDFVPIRPALELDGPILSLGQLEHLKTYDKQDLHAYTIDITFPKESSLEGFKKRIDDIQEEAITALKNGFTLIILSDRNSGLERLPIPSLLALSYLNLGLNETGRRLRTSLILEVGDVRNPHQVACLLSYGASAICPYMALETLHASTHPSLINLFPVIREEQFIKAMKEGVLKILSKRGISVLRSYQGSKLFTPLGLGQEVLDKFFKGQKSIMGGLSLENLFLLIKRSSEIVEGELEAHFLYKEHSSQKKGELHTFSSQRARLIHQMIAEETLLKSFESFKLLTEDFEVRPILLRHLFEIKIPETDKRQSIEISTMEEILTCFGSGAMSFGAISAESQRDLILAFKEINGRSNSGEGGENPYYESLKISASIKQIASGRFGVTATYLVNADEVQIKIAQGAKPGEGGQLMGEKVTLDIAKARFTSPGIELISPAPQHDIYSIEDLKQLIYEIKELNPSLKVSVKLVSAENIGAIAVGVVKAGADQFDFGKLLLIGEGCIMARICEKNTCPTGIATQSPKFKEHYKGNPEKIIRLLQCLALDVQEILKKMNRPSLKEIRGKNNLLKESTRHAMAIKEKGIDLSSFLENPYENRPSLKFTKESRSVLNQMIKDDIKAGIKSGLFENKTYEIINTDRAIPAGIAGLYALSKEEMPKKVQLKFIGSGGLGFGVFMVKEMELRLEGEANDSVAKSMSGGKITITPSILNPLFIKEENSIIGNCALYGATGGTLFVHGSAGDRFAVRNSGALAVVENVGFHACEYMSAGLVWILGLTKGNLGAGMSGGAIYTHKKNENNINKDYLVMAPITIHDELLLRKIGEDYLFETGSLTMKSLLLQKDIFRDFVKLIPY